MHNIFRIYLFINLNDSKTEAEHFRLSTMKKIFRPLWLAAILLWLVCTGVLIWQAFLLADGIVAQAEEVALRRATSGAATVSHYADREFDFLKHLATSVQRLMHMEWHNTFETNFSISAQVRSYLQVSFLSRMSLIKWVGITDSNGRALWSSMPDSSPDNHNTQPYFREIAASASTTNIGTLFFNDWMPTPVIPFSVNIQDGVGGTRARLIAFIDAFALSRELENLELGEGASATLLMSDGTIMARSREAVRAVGLRLPGTDLLVQRIAASPRGSTAKVLSRIDGRLKLAAYQRVDALPIYVAMALDREIEIKPFTFSYLILVSAAVALSALSLLLGILWFMYLRQRQIEKNLRHSQQQAQEMEAQLAHTHRMEALGSLAGGIAHDFNNVLQAVIAGTVSIQRRTSDENIKRILAMLNDAAQRGASVTRRLLSFARRAELRKEETDTMALFLGLEEVLKHTLANGIRIEFILPKQLPTIFVDRSQLESAIINLAVNARDAMEGQEGGLLKVTVSPAAIMPEEATALSLQPGAYIRVTLTDTGTGMDAVTLRRASEPFFTTKGVGKGTGLGLSMAKGFVEQSGGAFHIQSYLGAGTTIDIWLPCVAGPALIKSPVPTPSRIVSATTKQATSAEKKLLLVDDESAVRELLGAELREMGWQVTISASGAEALKRLKTGQTFDVLVTDLNMPGMDGLHLIRAARKVYPCMPALLITGHAGTGHTEALRAEASSGAFELVNKSFDARDLSVMAEILIQQAQASKET